ncbi:MAG: Stp1/IreP family PP2C-type Ser/Thr phosphatase [Anaerolineales bacterium]|nr:Stp1/IreP family PP2C-type Ser/Thr phosphatase [Anaerolineales bacterium]
MRPNQNTRTNTRPLKADRAFKQRPAGAIFGDAFLYENISFSDDRQKRYIVRQVAREGQIVACPKPDCGALFPARVTAPEKYCTDCGADLEPYTQEMVLTETLNPIPDNLAQVAMKGLSHGSVRAPLAIFTEHLAGVPHYCIVAPQVVAFDGVKDTLQAIEWGIGLARGLDYLHDNGITYNGRLDANCFGMANGRAVWTGFNGCVHHPEGYVSDRQADTRALAALIFFWLTGATQFEPKTNLPPGVNLAFEHALGAPGAATGWELAQVFEQALDEVSAPQAVDYHMGRRTHVGMVRSLNEDSLLALEINRIQQSYSQPLAVYVVADGMGGHTAGEIASGTIVNAIARKALAELFPSRMAQNESQDHQDWLREAIEVANREVLSLRKAAGTDMGSTLVAAVLDGNRLSIAHVGDSRIYLVNAQGIQRLTIDHSLVERLIATEQITRQEARHHPQRNVIYRTIGDKSQIEVDVSTRTLALGDYVLLCSDGLSGMVEDDVIHRIVMQSVSPQAACDKLIDAANAAGGDDNISVVIVEIVQA